jgi:hypothetical protein
MKRSRKWDAAAIVVGCVLAAVVGEVGLRLVWPQRSAVTLGMFRQDPDAGYSLLPGYRNVVRVPEFTSTIQIDERGDRVAQDALPEGERAQRILAIGDSFTFGVGVEAEDTYAERLERELDPAVQGLVAVRNGGVGGYGPLRSERHFLAAQASWAPDVLIHGLYVGNDLEDPHPETFLLYPHIEDGRMVRSGRHPFARVRAGLRVHSHLYALLRDRLYGLYEASPFAQRSQHLDPMGLQEWPASIVEESWPAGQEAISHLAAWSAENGADYLVVLIPIKYQVDDEAWEVYRKRWNLPHEAFDRDRPQRVVRAFLDAAGIPYVDLLPAFRASPEGLYYRVDNHWTPEGHARAAGILAAKLRALGWLAGDPSRADVARAGADGRPR